jgi:hypothetical protein
MVSPPTVTTLKTAGHAYDSSFCKGRTPGKRAFDKIKNKSGKKSGLA